jgi:hypothetical protein
LRSIVIQNGQVAASDFKPPIFQQMFVQNRSSTKSEHGKHLIMKNVSSENLKSIEENLKELGFTNTSDIFKSATTPFNLLNSGDPPIRAMLMFDTTSDADRMYSFVVAKSENNEWYIHSIEAAGFVRSLQNPEGILSDGISYNVQDRSLPHKDQIIKDVDKATKIQEIRNRFKRAHPVEKRKRYKL